MRLRPAIATAEPTASRPPALLALLRPAHWVKNLLVLAPLVFAGRLFDAASLRAELLMLAAFCLLASATYALNDVHDEQGDRSHPRKRSRPLASGALSRNAALTTAAVCGAGGLALGWHLQTLAPPFGAGLAALGPLGFCLLYLALTAAYTFVLRAIAGLDVLALATGFVLRAYAGSVALQLLPSHWLVICSFALALFLAAGKRRLEISQVGTAALAGRPSLTSWSLPALDRVVEASAALAVITYVVYSISPETAARVGGRGLVYSAPIVAWLVARTRNRLRRDAAADPVELVLRDPPTLLGLLAFGAVVLLVIYHA